MGLQQRVYESQKSSAFFWAKMKDLNMMNISIDNLLSHYRSWKKIEGHRNIWSNASVREIRKYPAVCKEFGLRGIS